MGIAELVAARGGFATTRELRAAGATERMLTAAVRFRHVRRARNGWYSTAPPADPRFRAVRVGGRLTGLSAFRAWGAWVLPRASVLHVAVPYNAARLRDRAGVRVHYVESDGHGSATEVSVADALLRVLLDEPPDVAVACMDWLLHTGRADLIDLHRVALRVPRSRQGVMRLVGGRSQSVLESVARARLRQSGFHVLTQQRTGELGASDLVIEGAVALELDGRAFHADSFESDRRRDLQTTREGKHVIRASERMMREVWPQIEGAVRAALRARGVGISGSPARAAPIPRQPHRAPAWGS
jgi:very-short-patch-repair endonuclease